jgi:hypothetical protein
VRCQNYIDKQEEKVLKINKLDPKQLPDLD